jgi:hypothetical protein
MQMLKLMKTNDVISHSDPQENRQDDARRRASNSKRESADGAGKGWGTALSDRSKAPSKAGSELTNGSQPGGGQHQPNTAHQQVRGELV